MKNPLRSLMLIAFGLLAARPTSASLAMWNFGAIATGPLSGYGASSADSSFSTTPALSTSGGVTPSVAGGVLIYSFARGNATALDGSILTFTIHTGSQGINNLSASYTAGFTTLNQLTGSWSYSINGGSFTSFGGVETIAAGGNTDSTGWNAISVGANQTLTLQFALNGAGTTDNGHAGTLTFDDWTINGSTFNISPVPEPMNCALAAFGLILVGGGAGRRYFRSRRAVA